MKKELVEEFYPGQDEGIGKGKWRLYGKTSAFIPERESELAKNSHCRRRLIK